MSGATNAQKQAIIQQYLSTPDARMKLAGYPGIRRPVPRVIPDTPLNLKRRKF